MASTNFDYARSRRVQFASLNSILFSLKKTCSETSTSEGYALHVFKYPRASLLGLPTELRLQIYTHLAERLHFHVDVPIWQSEEGYRYRSVKNRKLRLCNATDASFRQLCKRPLFSGLETKESLCHAQPASSSDPFALRATCRQIYDETKGILEKSKLGLTVDAEFTRWVLPITAPATLQSLTRLTILHASMSFAYSDMHSSVAWLCSRASLLPSLRTLAVQTPLPYYKFCVKRPGSKSYPQFTPKRMWHKVWFVKSLHEAFGGRVDVILDAWVVVRAGYRDNKSTVDEIVVMRGIAWADGHIEQEGDVQFEIVRREMVVEAEEKAEWKKWWMNNNLGYGKKPS